MYMYSREQENRIGATKEWYPRFLSDFPAITFLYWSFSVVNHLQLKESASFSFDLTLP